MIAMMLTLSMLAASLAGCAGGDDDDDDDWTITKASDAGIVWVESGWDPIIPNLNDGTMCDVIISAMTKTATRDEVVDFTRAYYTSSQGVIGAAGTSSLSSVLDLNMEGVMIGVQSGTTSDIFANGDAENEANLPLATVNGYEDFPTVIAALENGDVSYVLGDAPVLALEGTLLTQFSDENFGFAVREDSGELLDALNVAIGAVVSSGEYDEIFGAHFEGAVILADDTTADTATAYPTPSKDSTLTAVLESGQLKVCTDPFYPPFESYDADNNVVGFDADIAHAVADEIAAHYMGTENPVFVAPRKVVDVKIGFLNPITGPLAGYSAKFTGAANMAIADLNAMDDGTGTQYVFHLVEGDSGCSGTTAATAAQTLADAGVHGVAGAACSGASMAANGVLGPLGIPMISYASTNPGLTDDTAYPHFYRVVPSDAYQGPAIAALATGEGVTNPALLHMTNDYGAGLAGAFEDAWGTANLCNKAGYADGTTDFASLVQAIKDAGCDSVVMITYATDGAAIIETMAGLNMSLPTFGADGVASEDFLTEFNVSAGSSPALTNGLKATKPRAGSTDFVARCAANADCAGGIYTAEAYDAVMILGKAAKMEDGAKMDTHIPMVGTNYAAASASTLTFDANGDVAPVNGYSACQFDALSVTDVYFNCMNYWDQTDGITAEEFTGTTVKIGLLAPLTGSLAVYGPGFVAAATIAMGVMNIAGYGNGVQFEMVTADSACSETTAATSAQSLADAGVWGVVGAACSGATGGAHGVLDPLGIPMISYASTNPALGAATNFFRTVPSDASQGPAIAAAVVADGNSNPALLHMTNDYGSGLAGSVKAAWTALDSDGDGTNNALCAEIGYADTTTDFSSQVQAVQDNGCDSVILVSYDVDGAAVIEEMAANGDMYDSTTGTWNVSIFGGDGIAKTGIGKSMSDNSSMAGVVATLPASGAANARTMAFNALCSAHPACDTGIYTKETFDAFLIMGYSIFTMMTSEGLTKAQVIGGVGTNFEGAAGIHTFGYDGNAADISPVNGYCVGTFSVDSTAESLLAFTCDRTFTEADGIQSVASS